MKANKKSLKIALVFDWLTTSQGGVERLLPVLLLLFPQADIYTSTWNPRLIDLEGHKVYVSWLRFFPQWFQRSRISAILLYPHIFEGFDFSSYDVVLSLCSGFSKSLIVRPPTIHLCYLLTPVRYLWGFSKWYHGASSPFGTLMRIIGAIVSSHLRRADYVAATRADIIFTLSHAVQKRISHHYGRQSTVLYPPFDIDYWKKMRESASKKILKDIQLFGPYFLIVSRMEPYKNLEMALRVFENHSERLVVVGTGRYASRLINKFGKRIRFLQEVTDEQLASLYKQAQALIMPQEEDFGYVALEAQMCGCPVIAYRRGGALETVHHLKTGILYEFQTEASLQEALAQFHTVSYNLHKNLEKPEPYLERFSKKYFEHGLQTVIDNTV